jgi:hypothetical protein
VIGYAGDFTGQASSGILSVVMDTLSLPVPPPGWRYRVIGFAFQSDSAASLPVFRFDWGGAGDDPPAWVILDGTAQSAVNTNWGAGWLVPSWNGRPGIARITAPVAGAFAWGQIAYDIVRVDYPPYCGPTGAPARQIQGTPAISGSQLHGTPAT